MRILHVIDHFGLGGAQTFLLSVLSAWPGGDDTLEVVSLGRKRRLRERLDALAAVRVHGLEAGKFDLRVISRIREIVREGDFDIVHAHLPKSILVCLFLQPRMRARLILHEHALCADWPLLYRLAVRRWRERPAGVLAPSNAAARIVEERLRVPKHKIRVVHGAINTESLAAAQKDPVPRSSLGVGEGAVIAGYVGRLAPVKGVDCFLRALALVRKQRPETEALIVGDGPLRPRLVRQARKLGLSDAVHFVGYRPDALRWIALFDVGVVPSRSESFGISALECEALGVPVVASDVGGLPEIVKHESTGLLVPPGDPAALAAALIRLVSSPETRLAFGQNAAAHVRECFSVEQTVAALRETYEKALEPNR